MKVFKDNFKNHFLYWVLASVVAFIYIYKYQDKDLLMSVLIVMGVLLVGYYEVAIGLPKVTITEEELKMEYPFKLFVWRKHLYIFKKENIENIEIIRPVLRIMGANPVIRIHYYKDVQLKSKTLVCDFSAAKLDELKGTLNEYGYHCEEG